MNRKIIAITFALLTGTVFTSAAQYRFKMVELGVKAGLNVENTNMRKASDNLRSFSTGDKLGYHAGLMARINLPFFHIQPEIVYSWNKYNLNMNQGGLSSRSKVKVNTVDMPVLAGLRLFFIHLQAGPVFNLMTDTSVKSGATPTHVDMTRPTVSYMLGAGLDFGRLNVDVRYNGQFKKAKQHIAVGEGAGLTNYDFKTGLNNWLFSVGYLF